jgi:hypothetical protein
MVSSVGIGVDRGHEPLVDADGVVEHLGDRGEAIGCAGGVGDDLVIPGELVVVDPVDHGEVGAVGRRRHQHALGAGGEMQRGLVLGGEDAGALERDVDAELLPRQLRGVLLGGDLDRAVADADGVALDRHGTGKAAVHRVVSQQMRVGLDRAEIVDADDLDIGALGLGDGAQHIAADAAETVDGDADRHGTRLLPISSGPGRTQGIHIVV